MVKVVFDNPLNNEEIKDMLKVDMHCHTNVSDGKDSADTMIKQAKKLKIGISITDHNEIYSSLKACKSTFAIPGIEITSSDAIDFLVYFYKFKNLEDFYNRHIKGKHLSSKIFNLRKINFSTADLLDKVREYNCVVVLPHPLTMRPKNSYIYMQSNSHLLKYIDAIEVINSIMKQESNEIAVNWAKKLNKGITGASDAHMSKNLGAALTASYANDTSEFLDNIKKKKNIVVGKSLDTFSNLHTKFEIFRRNLTW